MTRPWVRTLFLAAIVVLLSVIASIGAAGGAPIGEPGLVPPTALGGTVGALALALLIVAVVRCADR